ncbi:MAG: type II secretion system minor pseudopilin GspJ [Sphingobium sp.]|nr:type II secretion system minor pseudopilin GspJ [Sphingobium sp.]
MAGCRPVNRSRSSSRSAEHGFASSWRSAQEGFTLIELLVSLFIFGLLASAGVMLLRGSVDTQAAVRTHLDALADTQRGISTLDADLSQAVVRISRLREGTSAPAFFGRHAQQSEPLMQFVRGGWSNPANQRHPSIQRVEYWWRDGKIERVSYPQVDGAKATEPAILFDHVMDVKVRYRSPKGDWLDIWATEPNKLPVAVEFVVTRAGGPALTLNFLVGPAVGQREDQKLPSADGDTDEGLGNGA